MAEEKQAVNESGTWNITKSQITTLVQSDNPNDRPSLVSPLQYNPKKQIAFRIQLTASPASNGMINLCFQLNVSLYNSYFRLQISCNQPYFSKTDSTSYSVSQSVNKSTLLSCNGMAIRYTVQPPQDSGVFSAPDSYVNYNQMSQNNASSLPSGIKPISFECTVTSAMMQQVATKAVYQSNQYYSGVLLLKSIHDTVTNTMWSLYLQCSSYQRQYSLVMQAQHTKADLIYAWIDIECPEVMYYGYSDRSEFYTKQDGSRQQRIATVASLTARVTNEQTVKFKCNIFGQQWTVNNQQGQPVVNITSELCPVSMTSNDGDDALKRKVNEMALQIQALSTGLSNVIRVNQQLNTKLDGVQQIQQQLRNTANTNHSTMNTKLNAMKQIEEQLRNVIDTNHSAVSTKLNGMKENEAQLRNTMDANHGAMSTKLNGMKEIEEQLRNAMDSNQNEVNRKLDSVTAALGTLTSKISQGNDDHKSNENVVFDPVYAAFFYWLNNTVCLPRYVNAFKESGYDSMEAVVELNDEELQSIGVNVKGHRVRLLKAIKKYATRQQKEGTDYI
eukprot:803142_1